MRLLSVGFAGVLVTVSGCAAISGLGDYEEMPAADKAALTVDGADDSSSVVANDAGEDAVADDADIDASADDASGVYDARAYADVDLDAPPPCGPNCGGCCMNGTCVGGKSVNTCGVKGALCKDCTSTGACTSGACTTVKVDAAPPPTCDRSKCGGCIPFYQTGCCNADQTCGCEVSFSNNCK